MSLKLFNDNYGLYNLSFLRIDLNVDFDFSEYGWFNNSENERAVFVHEYIHYLQDIGTTYGLLNFNNTFAVIQGCMNFIANSQEDEIMLPINLDYIEGMEKEAFLCEIYRGDNKDLNNCQIFNIKCNTEEIYENQYGEKINQVVLSLRITNQFEEIKEEYIFGGMSILESMAYLIESNQYPGESTRGIAPYNLCEMVVQYLYDSFPNNKCYIAALCDISLMSLNPGFEFYNIINDMKENEFIPSDINSIYLYCQNKIKENMRLYKEQLYIANQRIDFMYPKHVEAVSDFKEINDWMKKILNKIEKSRENNFKFIIKMVECKRKEFDKIFLDIVKDYGLPLIKTKKNEILNGATISNPNLNLTYMNVPIILYRLFNNLEKNNCCDLIDLCKEYQIKNEILLVNENCYKNPIKNSEKDILCPLGLICYYRCLSGKTLIKR